MPDGQQQAQKQPGGAAPAADAHGPAAQPNAVGQAVALGGGAAAPAADPWGDFVAAARAYDGATMKTKWAALKTDDKQKLKTMPDIGLKAMVTLKQDALAIIHEGGLDFSNGSLSDVILDDAAADGWIAPLKTNSLWNSFLGGQPNHGFLFKQQVDNIGKMVQSSTGGDANSLFEKVYPKLNPGAKSATEVSVSWNDAQVKRLYRALQGLPVGHVQTVTGGFSLVQQYWDDNTKSLQPLGFAWWESGGRVVLPEGSIGADAKTSITGHDMTGGDVSGAPNAQPQAQEHFEGSALHEVGHGVGQKMGGNDYALKAAFPSFHLATKDELGRAASMWDGSIGAHGGGFWTSVREFFGASHTITNDEMRDFFATEIGSGKGTYKGTLTNKEYADMAAKAPYKDQPLAKYWGHVTAGNEGYNWPDERLKDDGWVYRNLAARWGGAQYCKYSKKAYDNKVSWYSVSSPLEWFAEQYSHFYRNNKANPGGLIDGTTFAKLQELDKQQFIAGSGGKSDVIIGGMDPGSHGGPQSGKKNTGAAAQAAQKGPNAGHRFPIQW